MFTNKTKIDRKVNLYSCCIDCVFSLYCILKSLKLLIK